MLEQAPAPVVPAVRRLLLVAALLVFLAGVQLFVFTTHTDRYFAWTIGSPMTAAFLGASYWSAIALEFTGARATTWAGARIAVPAVFVFTVLTLIVTLWHIDAFHLGDEFAVRTRLVTWGWIAVYAVVPVLMVLAVVAQTRRSRGGRAGLRLGSPLPVVVARLLDIQVVVLIPLGIALLAVPGEADALWSWPLTALTGRAIGAWLVGLGVGALHARLLDDLETTRPLAASGAVFTVLQLIALARYGSEVDWHRMQAAGYVATLAIIGASSTWVLLAARRGASAGFV